MPGINWKGPREARAWQKAHGPEQVPTAGPKKPRMGAPCNGCGLCCVAEPCAIAQIMIAGVSSSGPCPALEWRDGRSFCGMVLRPFHYSQKARDAGLPESVIIRDIKEDLGGVGGRCDSDPLGDPGALDGMTAAEFLSR